MGSWRAWCRQALTRIWDEGELPQVSGFDFRALSASAFLFSSGGLIAISPFIPNYLRSQWLPAYLGAGVVCFLLGALVVRVGRISGPGAIGIILFADVSITIAGFAQVDHSGGRIDAALLALPTLFIALFLPWGWLPIQVLLASACAWTILRLSGDPVAVVAIQTLLLLTIAACPAMLVLVLRDQVEVAFTESRALATTDPLTGLLNRRGLDDRAAGLIAGAARAGTPVGVLIADLDHFKQVNDRFGHAVGDQVLRVFARTTVRCVRAEDLVVRLGGEEIAVVGIFDRVALGDLAERLRQAVEAAGAEWGVTVSIGIAAQEPVGQRHAAHELLWAAIDRADDLLYVAKRAGRNQVACSATV